MDLGTSFGAILRRARRAARLTQEELAALADSHAVYISELERGVYSPTLAMLFELAKALGTHPAKLLEEIPSGVKTRIAGKHKRRPRRKAKRKTR